MLVEECDFPAGSSLDRQMVDAAFFQDSYDARLSKAHANMADIFFALFGHQPEWIKAIL